jgi:hypothetical protein
MKRPTEEDLQFLCDIHGRYQDSKEGQLKEKFFYFLFGVLFPLLLLIFFFIGGSTYFWVLAAPAIGLFSLMAILWRDRGLEYEFTGDEIIELRAGRIRNRLRISDVLEIKVNISPHQMILNTSNLKMTVRIFPSLNEAIQKKGAELAAKQREAERQRYEEVKREMTSLVKWANIIGAIASVLAAALVALVIRWFTTKH